MTATTYRNCAGVWGKRSLRLEDVVRPHTTTESGKRAAVTTVDLLLGGDVAGFVFGTNNSGGWYLHRYNKVWGQIGGNLNSGGNWDIVMHEMRETCVASTEKYSIDRRQKVTVFSVPAIGFLEQPTFANQWKLDLQQQQQAISHHSTDAEDDGGVILRKKSAMVRKVLCDPHRYFYWRGEFLDTANFYRAVDPAFDAAAAAASTTNEGAKLLCVVGPLTPDPPVLPPGVVPFLKNVRGRNAARHRVDLRHSRWATTQSRARNEWSDRAEYTAATTTDPGNATDYLEIDLQFPRLVTHIATAGAEPVVRPFPEKYDYARHMRRCVAGVVQVNRCAMSVQVSTGGELGWVSGYELQVLDPLTSKWRTVVVAAANSNALDVAVLDLRPHFTRPGGLYARRLRIRPLTFVHSPTLRVVVYGSSSISSSAEEDEKEGKDDGKERGDNRAAPPPITVDYLVTETRAKADCRFVRDGLVQEYGYWSQSVIGGMYGRYAFTKARRRHYFGQCTKYDRDDNDGIMYNDRDKKYTLAASVWAPEDKVAMDRNQSGLKAYRARTITWDFQS